MSTCIVSFAIQHNTFTWSAIFLESDHTVISEDHHLVGSGNGKCKAARALIAANPSE